MIRALLLLVLSCCSWGESFFVRSQDTANSLLASATVLNTSSPALTRTTGAYDPVLDAISLPNARRQRNVSIGSSTYAMDLSEANSTTLLLAGTSGRFDMWTAASGLTVTPDTTASPSGETTAQTLTDPGASLSSAQQTFTVLNDSLNHVFSIYVLKTAGGTAPTFGVTLALTGGTGVTTNARINTDTGAQQYGSNANTTIETSAAGTWYRIIVKIANNTSGNTTLTLDVYPAAAAYGASVDSAAATGTAICTYACLVKRGWAPSFVSNRNMILSSEDLTAWTTTRSSATGNTVANPLNAEVTADTLTEDGTVTNTHFARTAGITKVSGAQSMVYSGYFKGNGRNWVRLALADSTAGTNAAGAWFNITSGSGATGSNYTAGASWSTTAKAITSLGSGWYKCAITVTTGTGTTVVPFSYLSTADSVTTYSGDGTSAIYSYGSQVEYGTAATTYWATSTVTSLRTRDALVSTTSMSTTAGTLMFLVRPYGWTGTTTDQGGTTTLSADTNFSFNIALNGATITKLDGGSQAASTASGLGFTDATVTTTFATWDATALRGYGGTTTFNLLTPDTTLSAPWAAISTVPIGHNANTTDRNDDGYNLVLYWSSALTPAQQQILINAIH